MNKKKFNMFDQWYLNNKNFKFFKTIDKNIKNLLLNKKLKINNLLEIGCSNGHKLNEYSKLLNPKIIYGVDISKLAILDGKKKFKKINFLNISSFEIDKIKINFDFIICGFFLAYLKREDLFKQFDLILKKINQNGYLLILDFDPLFKHSNPNHNLKNSVVYKMSYDNILVDSGTFEIVYKNKYLTESTSKQNFKSKSVSLTLYKKINYLDSYPFDI